MNKFINTFSGISRQFFVIGSGLAMIAFWLLPQAAHSANTLRISQVFSDGNITGSVPSGCDYVELYNSSNTPIALDGTSIQISDTPSHPLISQVQVGGNAAADEFVELYNPTSQTVELEGWRLRRTTSTDSSGTTLYDFPTGASIAPGGFYLVAGSGYDDTIIADATASSSTIAASNHIRLCDGACTESNADLVVDRIGYGSATRPEGSAAAGPSNNGSAIRSNLGGNADTDDNSIDFSTLTIATPRNSASSPVAAATSWQVISLPSGSSIPANGYYLIVSGSCTGLPAGVIPDHTATFQLSTYAEKIALVSNSDPITASTDSDILDFIGYGNTQDAAEGNAAASGLGDSNGNNLALFRKTAGCTDTDNNAADIGIAPATARDSSDNFVCPVVPIQPTPISNAKVSSFVSWEVDSANNSAAAHVDMQDDAWRTDTGGTTFAVGTTFFAGADSNTPPTVLSEAYTNGDVLNVTASMVDMTNSDNIYSICDERLTGTIRANSQVTNFTSSLQDGSPKPTVSGNVYTDVSKGDWNSSNGVLFTFNINDNSPADGTDLGIASFGAWFGDLETRNDADDPSDNPTLGGQAAYVRLFDPGCNQIDSDILIPAYLEAGGVVDNIDDTNYDDCGADNTAGNTCGNHTTRFIGFNSPFRVVKYMLVVVGDDDIQGADGVGNPGSDPAINSCSTPGDRSFKQICQGGKEFLSFTAPTVPNDPAGDPTAITLVQLSATSLPNSAMLLVLVSALGIVALTLIITARQWRKQLDRN